MTIRSKLRIRSRLNSVRTLIWPPKPKPLILMYHRIANEPVNHWGLSVSPSNFAEHLRILRRTRYPLPLMTFVQNLITGTLKPNAVVVTFDDGYADNFIEAKPLLLTEDVPATIFVTTGYLNRVDPIWSDELSRLILLEKCPHNFEIIISGECLKFDFGAEPSACEDGTTRVDLLKRRMAVLWKLRDLLMVLNVKDRDLIMNKIRIIFAKSYYRSSLGRMMTSEEVRKIAADGLVTIGAHTVTHPVLPKLDKVARYREVIASKLECEALVETPVVAFAYPYGEVDSETRDTVKMAGFKCACSVQRGPVVTNSDVFSLPRIYISDVGGDAFEQALISASRFH